MNVLIVAGATDSIVFRADEECLVKLKAEGCDRHSNSIPYQLYGSHQSFARLVYSRNLVDSRKVFPCLQHSKCFLMMVSVYEIGRLSYTAARCWGTTAIFLSGWTTHILRWRLVARLSCWAAVTARICMICPINTTVTITQACLLCTLSVYRVPCCEEQYDSNCTVSILCSCSKNSQYMKMYLFMDRSCACKVVNGFVWCCEHLFFSGEISQPQNIVFRGSQAPNYAKLQLFFCFCPNHFGFRVNHWNFHEFSESQHMYSAWNFESFQSKSNNYYAWNSSFATAKFCFVARIFCSVSFVFVRRWFLRHALHRCMTMVTALSLNLLHKNMIKVRYTCIDTENEDNHFRV